MRYIEKWSDLKELCRRYGYDGVLDEILEIEKMLKKKRKLINERRSLQAIKRNIISWWNDFNRKTPTLDKTIIPYFLLWHLRKEINKKIEKYEKKGGKENES